MTEKVIRDPLYNYISLSGQDRWLLELFETPEVQRIRRIHQLGVSNLTYPGADHNRFAHTLGVVHLMQHVFNHLGNTNDDARISEARQPLLAAALLHDVGHGPYSHLFEPCLGIDHEDWSIKIIEDESTEVNRVLRKRNPNYPDQVAGLIRKDDSKYPTWQKALISSQLDVDRIDYLRRDSLFTGAGYGHFDWHRILNTMILENRDDGDYDIIWPSQTALAIEEYIFARFYMYQNVYLHKTTRGYEVLLQAMWKRSKQLRDENTKIDAVRVLEAFWSTSEPSIQQYLDIEEFTVLSQIQAWKDHPDPVLSDLATRFINRDGFKVVTPPEPENELAPDFAQWEDKVYSILKQHRYDLPEYFCLQDLVKGKYRTPYLPEKEEDEQTSQNSIRVLDEKTNQPIEISEYLPRLKAVTKSVPDRVRYYVPSEVRDKVQQVG